MKKREAPFVSRVSLPPVAYRSALIIVLIAAATFGTTACGARRTPNLERIFADARARAGKRPVIVIPGVLGSQLVNRRTGEVVWPSVFRSAADGLSLPIALGGNGGGDVDPAKNRDDLRPVKIVDTARLLRYVPAEVYVYYELLEALRRYGGYQEGNWEEPGPGGDRDTFYVFPYDWRLDNVETAREFVRRVEELKRKLNRPDLRFNVVAHSMGGLVARYAAMYGDSDLPAAGRPPAPSWAGASAINKVFMFGTPNEGSAEAFATLLEGYSVTEGLRRRVRLFNKLTREDVVTIPAVYQLLPHRGAARFFDENLQPLNIDLYDPAVWRRYGWSAINDPDFRQRFARGAVRSEDDRRPQGGTLEDLDAHLAAMLGRAKRFHEALNTAATAADVPPSLSPPSPYSPVPLFAFGGDCEETLAAPIVLRDEKRGRWITLVQPRGFRTGDGRRRVSREEAVRVMYEPGDGRVTRRSLLGDWLGAQPGGRVLYNTTLPVAYAVFACDLHSDLHNNKTLQDNALTLLVREVVE